MQVHNTNNNTTEDLYSTVPFELTHLVVMVKHTEVANGKDQFMQKCMILKVGTIPAIHS